MVGSISSLWYVEYNIAFGKASDTDGQKRIMASR
jgi:hypothetical protein